jgi:lysozyme
MRYWCMMLCLLAPTLGGDSAGTLVLPMVEFTGIDVSHYQREIAWDTIAARRKVQFAFVKATEGTTFVDTMFCKNWESMRRAGVRRGAYHYFRSYGCGYDQARHFLSTVEMMPGDIIPVLDIESTDGMPPEIMLEEMRIWLHTVEHNLKVKPIIYTYQHFYDKYLSGLIDQYPLWIARYGDTRPVLNSGRQWDIWQFSNNGCVEGISQRVDLNKCTGPPSMLEQFCWYPEQEIIEKIPFVMP